MVAVLPSSMLTRPDGADDQRSEERLTHVERELTGLRKRLDNLLSYIRQDDMAPLTPVVRMQAKVDRQESPDV